MNLIYIILKSISISGFIIIRYLYLQVHIIRIIWIIPMALNRNTVNKIKHNAIANATKNIAGTATLSGDNYVFEGVLDIDKDARDTSYSGVGYIKITMKDGNVIVAYADYAARQHAYALSDLVDLGISIDGRGVVFFIFKYELDGVLARDLRRG